MAFKTIITCDICDSIIEADSLTKMDFEYPNTEKYAGVVTEDSRVVHYDLCPKCAAKISNYVRNLKEDYNAR